VYTSCALECLKPTATPRHQNDNVNLMLGNFHRVTQHRNVSQPIKAKAVIRQQIQLAEDRS